MQWHQAQLRASDPWVKRVVSAARLNCDTRPCSSRLHSCGRAARSTATGNLCGKAHWLCRPEERELWKACNDQAGEGAQADETGSLACAACIAAEVAISLRKQQGRVCLKLAQKWKPQIQQETSSVWEAWITPWVSGRTPVNPGALAQQPWWVLTF